MPVCGVKGDVGDGSSVPSQLKSLRRSGNPVSCQSSLPGGPSLHHLLLHLQQLRLKVHYLVSQHTHRIPQCTSRILTMKNA